MSLAMRQYVLTLRQIFGRIWSGTPATADQNPTTMVEGPTEGGPSMGPKHKVAGYSVYYYSTVHVRQRLGWGLPYPPSPQEDPMGVVQTHTPRILLLQCNYNILDTEATLWQKKHTTTN